MNNNRILLLTIPIIFKRCAGFVAALSVVGEKNTNHTHNTEALGIALSSSDSSVLDYISDLPFSLAGNTKYMAAAMINKEVHDELAVNSNRMSIGQSQKESPEAEVFPNPAKDKVYFILSAKAVISIYDNAGKKIFESLTLKKVFEFDCSKLNDGLYNYRISQSNNSLKTGNFVVIH